MKRKNPDRYANVTGVRPSGRFLDYQNRRMQQDPVHDTVGKIRALSKWRLVPPSIMELRQKANQEGKSPHGLFSQVHAPIASSHSLLAQQKFVRARLE